jgi:hypothetical protein
VSSTAKSARIHRIPIRHIDQYCHFEFNAPGRWFKSNLAKRLSKPLSLSQSGSVSSAAILAQHDLPPSALPERCRLHSQKQIEEQLSVLTKPDPVFNFVLVGTGRALEFDLFGIGWQG